MINATELLEFIDKYGIDVSPEIKTEIKENNTISYFDLVEFTHKLMWAYMSIEQMNSEQENVEQQIETQQLEINELKKELEITSYQLYQEQIEKQKIIESNEKLQALSTEYNKLSNQKDILFTIIELMLNKN